MFIKYLSLSAHVENASVILCTAHCASLMLLESATKRRLTTKGPVSSSANNIIDRACKRMIADMPSGVLHGLSSGFSRLCSKPGVLTCGSICSGSGMGELSVHYALQRVLKVCPTNVSIKMEARFVCELVDDKANWLASMNLSSPGMAHFKDAQELGASKAFCRRAGRKIEVPGVDLVHAGVSCKDLSQMNDAAAENLCIIIDWLKTLSIEDDLASESVPDGTTAITLLATLKYVLRHKPTIIMIENVKAFLMLKDELCRLFREMGYAVHFVSVNSNTFGVPQSRPRIYLFACNRLGLPEMPHIWSPEFLAFQTRWGDRIDRSLTSFKQTSCADISDFLLPHSSADLKGFVHELSMPKELPEETVKWPDRHTELFKSIGCPGRTGRRQRAAFRSCLSDEMSQLMFDRLCVRQQEIVIFFSILWTRAGVSCEWAVDTSQNLWRLGKEPTMDMVPCLTGTSRIWLVRSQHLMMGEECLGLQGINRNDFHGWHKFPNSLLWSLAGNAFTGGVAAAVLYAGVGAGTLLES